MDNIPSRSAEYYRSLIQGAAYGIFRTRLDGTILDANPALARMLGYGSVDELLAMNMSAIYKSPTERASLIDRYKRTAHPTMTADVAWRRKDGSEIVVHLSARAVTNEDGSIGFEGIAEDITEKRVLEEQLRRAQKMEAVGRLARGVAHDFNNVLAAILGTADLLAYRFKDDPAAREDAEQIRAAAERGALLTKQLMAFSRGHTLDPKLLDLHAVIPEMQPMLEAVAGQGHRLVIRTSGSAALARVEPGHLEQVMTNLVVNARDAMPNGGAIEIDVSVIELDGRAGGRYAGMPAGPYVRISVHDSGTGIEPDLQAHIFEPFFTTKGTAATGLGLSIVYGIARDRGGTVAFSSAPGKGTTFDVIFPEAIPTSRDPET